MTAPAQPPVVDAATWQHELEALRAREKAATRELDAIAAQRRRLPMVKLPYGRQEEWQDSPAGWPQSPTYSRWGSAQDIAAAYGPRG